MNSVLAIAGAGLIAALAAGLIHQWRRRIRMERLLDDTNARLERLQIQFGRFAPDDLIEKLADEGVEIEPTRRRVTVLFADLQGFTRLCDQLDPAEIVPILNGYFQRMSQTVTDHHGRVTELTGDGLLALFGALEHNPWMERDAVDSALAMRSALAAYNRWLAERKLPQLSFGIGIHQGEVIAGVMGNADLSKFGVVGDTINLAARVESLTRTHGVDVLITEEVRQALDTRYRLRDMPPTDVKGKREPIVTYHVVAMDESAAAG